jgi:pilus assembly protein Flp/PilA
VQFTSLNGHQSKERRGILELFHRFIIEQQGADAVEYALVIALIALAIVAGATFMGHSIGNKLSTIGGSVTTCNATTCP